jgi:hypothetical protein
MGRQFPQFSTAQNADRVTNNLDREFEKAKTGSMCHGSPSRTIAIPSAGVSLKTNPLLRNPLASTPCGSIFCLSCAVGGMRNSMKIMTFEIALGKLIGANPLFRNILPASPCGSRFYGRSGDQAVCNSFEMNILEITARKSEGCQSGGPSKKADPEGLP